MSKTTFEYVDKEAGKLAVLIPGWATDRHIFDRLDMAYDLLFPVEIDIDDFIEKLAGELERKSRKAVLIGWSLGGLLAAHFTAKHPGLVERTVLVSVRSSYTEDEIGRMEEFIRRNRKGYLKMFYRKCLSGHCAEDKEWFDVSLRDGYLKTMEEGPLRAHLRFFAGNGLPFKALKKCGSKLVFVHGADDVIASMDDMYLIKKRLPGAHFVVMERTGHLPFLHGDFKNIVEGASCPRKR
jgi:pimeloyl-ACP methyl ester carboxylesterase